jgi:pyruvate kinase
LGQQAEALRTAPTPRGDLAVKSHRLLERLQALRGGRTEADLPPKKPSQLFDEPDALREADTSKNGAAINSRFDPIDVVQGSQRATSSSSAQSARRLQELDAARNGRGQADQPLNPDDLLSQVDRVADDLVRAAPENPDALQELHPSHRLSGCNLLHYLALRRCDVRPLQARLAEQGLASLGRAEPHVAASFHALRSLLHRSVGEAPPAMRGAAPNFAEGLQRLADATVRLLGAHPQGRRVRIMVTVSAEEAKGTLIRSLLQAGMNCMRINCAHNGPEDWLALVRQLRAAEKELGKRCKIQMDVSGPKPRTGPVEPGPPMLKWRPAKNKLGQLIRPAIIALAPREGGALEDLGADAVLRLPPEFLDELRPREQLKLKDARGAPRRLIVRAKYGAVWLAEGHSTAYVTDGIALRAKRSGAKARVCGLPRVEEPILLETGDALRLTKSLAPGRPALRDVSGRLAQPAVIGCTLGEAFCQLRVGQRVLLDDGKIECAIRSVDADGALLDVVGAPPAGVKLRSDRGVNLPDSRLRLPALTAKDLRDLSFIAQHADLVGFSFVQRPNDVFQLQEHLARLGKPQMGIILKVETRRAFENLPALLWAAMRTEAVGVMIARGDLGVECGYERLAEVQEEILWLCEAAHVPVIWATQVLESLAKRGVPSRAEITDAAMSERAECVMLNKGPHIEKAVTALDGILSRMQSRPTKTPMPRELHSWDQPPWP